MTRKKSRPTHRENAATVPSNEGGFYKMFWNSMETNPGANGQNSPSQGDVHATSPPVIIIDDSTADGSPCVHENSCENLVVPLPIKEETPVEDSSQPSPKTSLENVQVSHPEINGGSSSFSHPTCPPGNTMTSQSKNSSPSLSQVTPPISLENLPLNSNCADFATAYDPSTEVFVPAIQPEEAPCMAEEDGQLPEDFQVCDQLTSTEEHVEMFPDRCKVVSSNDSPEQISEAVVISNQSLNVVNSRGSPVPNEASLAPQVFGVVTSGTPACTQEHVASISEASSIVSIPAEISDNADEMSSETLPGIPEETVAESPMDIVTEPHSPAVHINYEENTQEPPDFNTSDPQCSTGVDEENVEDPPMNDIASPSSPVISDSVGRTLNLLQSLLNAPDEDLEDFNEAFPELPDLIGQPQYPSENSVQNEEDVVEFDSAQESSFHSNAGVSNLDVDQSPTEAENTVCDYENMDVSGQDQANVMMVDEEEEKFPTYSNFIPKKIKVDSIGILRSVKLLKDSVRALYKEYLKDDVILRTVNTPEPLVEESNKSSDEVQTTQTSSPFNVYPICCVKMERLPDPFVEKSTVTMSDETFKTWKRQIIQQRNEEKFRHLKVWRRGRTRLWRECELAGMDRATYDEQVAYVKKHKLNENSSSDSDSSGDDSSSDASSHLRDSSEASSSDEEHEHNEMFSMNSSETSPEMKQKTSVNRSAILPRVESETSIDMGLPENEYTVVERTSTGESSTAQAPSALKITIRKTSMSKEKEDDKEKPIDTEDTFPVPAKPIKTRKVATKRTFRRPSEQVPKANIPTKPTLADTKKSKIAAEDEDLYDQSLLGRRSYEVENFNLLEKWDIPFEQPTLFRSPRAASRLAQLRTKEAFAPILKRHAPPKAATSTATVAATTVISTSTVNKDVKEVVEWLCSKTVEAMLFPGVDPAGTEKCTETNYGRIAGKDSSKHKLAVEVPSKYSVFDETSSTLDESSEMSQSETSSTLDASSDFGGSTASLASEDFVPPKDKSPRKPRRRRRIGPAWIKKKKVKDKAAEEPVETRRLSTEHPAAEKPKLLDKVCDSTAHSTQVPVVSEGPGQSPRDSEDDSAHRMKQSVHQTIANQTVYELTEKRQPSVGPNGSKTPSQQPQPHRETQEVIQPRLTRSKKPTVELDPELLENFGLRKRKPKAGVLDDVSSEEGTKKPKPEKLNQQNDKLQSSSIASKLSEGLDSTTEDDIADSNTQVPEVSEGPGEVALDNENKQDQEKKEETPARVLRSRSRGPCPTNSTAPTFKDGPKQKTDAPAVRVGEEKPVKNVHSEEPLVLESPQSPPPEPVEQEPLVNGRVTRSKKRARPAYVAERESLDGSTLPSVCDVVDSIARQRLPLNKILDDSVSVTRQPTEPIQVCRLQTSNANDPTFVPTSSSSEPQSKASNESLVRELIPPPSASKGTCVNSKLNQTASPMDSDSSIDSQARAVKEASVDGAGQSGEFYKVSVGGVVPCSPVVRIHLTDGGIVAVEKDTLSSADSSSGSLALNTPVTKETGKLEVLDTLTNILAVSSPTKVCHPVSTTGTLLQQPLSSVSLPISTTMIISSAQSSVSNMLTTPTASSTSLPIFSTSTQDITSILPGTFLNSLLNSTLDANLTTYNNVINDSTTLTDDPDGDLVIDEGEAPESDTRIDVNFWENLTNADLSDTNADFSDDDNNTDLADKINKIIKDQIHQDPVPVPSLKQKENRSSSNDSNKQQQALGEASPIVGETDKNASALNRRDSIDERTGLPNNLIQRLRDPRIRSRLLSHLEEVETNDKTPPATLAPLLNSLPGNSVTLSTVGDPQAAIVTSTDPRKKVDGVVAHSVSYPLSTADSLCPSSQAPAVSSVVTNTIIGAQLNTISSGLEGQTTPSVVPNSPLVLPGTLPLLAQGMPSIQPALISNQPEEPPDPSKVDFLVPPSDDEDEESIKRRPSKKAKKQVDIELMYKSPLEDLQSEARPGYGERAPRRYADNYPRRRSGEDRQPRWDERRSRVDGPRDRHYEERGRSRSRDRRFEDRGRSKSREPRYEEHGRSRSRSRFDDRGRDRSRSRDSRAYCDPPRREQSRDQRAYDPYPGGEHEIHPQHVDNMQVPYNQPPWSVGDPSFKHHQTMMRHPLGSPHWQPNYYHEPPVPPHPPIFMPEPPKIDYMETRLINLELLPKTTNLEVSPLKKVYSYFDKDSLQLFEIPKPQYDPSDQPRTIKMMDPVSEEMIDFIQTPRPTSGLTKKYFAHVPPYLNLDDVVKFHCISPAYVMVRDNEEDPSSSSDEEKDELDARQKKLLHHRKSALEHKKRLSRPVLEHHDKRERELSLEHHLQKESEPYLGGLGGKLGSQHQESSFRPGIEFGSDPLQNLLQNLPLLKEQYSLQASQPPLIPPPPPEWNDVDLRISRVLAAGGEDLTISSRSRSPSRERPSIRSRSRSVSPYRSRTSSSPRRRRRSRSRSLSPRSDMSISPTRSRSRSPSYSHRNPRRHRSRSRSSERSRPRRSGSPKRHSTSISPPRKHSRR